MLLAFSSLDVAVLVLYLGLVLAVGIFFHNQQRSTEDFFLAGRSLGWFPVGMSLMASLISALSFTGVPGQGYSIGLRTLYMPLAVWLTVPILWGVAIPMFRGLQLASIYEYLELRFDGRTRVLATLLFALWRILWLGGVLYAPCKAFSAAVGWDVPIGLLIVILGIVTTAYTFLGGIKAVVWTDVLQGLLMIGGALIVICSVWWALPGGPARVWEVANDLQRTTVLDSKFDWNARWTPWGFIPHFALAMLSFYLADQITAQRFLAAKSVAAARQSFLLNCGALTILFPALTYIGLCMLAFYHDQPQELRAAWVTNLDPRPPHEYFRRPGDDEPLLDPRRRDQALTPANIPQLVRDARILQPNRLEPFTSEEEFTNPETGEPLSEKLMMRKPSIGLGLGKGEVLLHQQAPEELFPCYVADQLPAGIAGLILAALLAASMSSMDSGLNSISMLLLQDIHERQGVGQSFLARWRGKTIDQLDDQDRMSLAKPLTLLIGAIATIAALAVGQLGNIFDIMIGVVNTFGASLLGVFLLGMFTRRTTAAGALAALIGGTIFTIGFMALYRFEALAPLRPFGQSINDVWTIVFGTGFTLGVGWGMSLFLGKPKSSAELRGLVAGCGEPGVLASNEGKPRLPMPPVDSKRWKK